MKILIAEDDFGSRKYLGKILESCGKCDFALNGIEALDAYALALNNDKSYDLICIDVMMPKADGIKVLKTIREIEEKNRICKSKRSKIIMTTALNDNETIETCREIGCEGFVTKPINMKNFIELLKKLELM